MNWNWNACLSFCDPLLYIPTLLPSALDLLPQWLAQRRRSEVCPIPRPPGTEVTGSWDSSWQVTVLLPLQWDSWMPALGFHGGAAPTERPLTEGAVASMVPGVQTWLLETQLAVVMVSYGKPWVFSPSFLSVCALRFVYHWIWFISTHLYSSNDGQIKAPAPSGRQKWRLINYTVHKMPGQGKKHNPEQIHRMKQLLLPGKGGTV